MKQNKGDDRLYFVDDLGNKLEFLKGRFENGAN